MGLVNEIVINTSGQGLYEITDQICDIVESANQAEGLCTLFVIHTSASLIIQENADPSARYDLENWITRMVPERDPNFTHTLEGPDDMPAHIKSVLTQTSIGIPIKTGRLTLGTWQGIYLWEHRRADHRRKVVVSIV